MLWDVACSLALVAEAMCCYQILIRMIATLNKRNHVVNGCLVRSDRLQAQLTDPTITLKDDMAMNLFNDGRAMESGATPARSFHHTAAISLVIAVSSGVFLYAVRGISRYALCIIAPFLRSHFWTVCGAPFFTLGSRFVRIGSSPLRVKFLPACGMCLVIGKAALQFMLPKCWIGRMSLLFFLPTGFIPCFDRVRMSVPKALCGKAARCRVLCMSCAGRGIAAVLAGRVPIFWTILGATLIKGFKRFFLTTRFADFGVQTRASIQAEGVRQAPYGKWPQRLASGDQPLPDIFNCT